MRAEHSDEKNKMLNEEEIKKIKEQIIQQIDSWKASDEQKEQAKKQILSVPAEQLEEFLAKNNLIKQQETANQEKSQTQECPFCLILQGKIPAYKIEENKKSIAILEISPLSKGHILVVSKQHDKLFSSSFSLANRLAKKLKSKLKPENIKIENSEISGHHLINIIPVYKDIKLERKKASQEELKELQEKLISKPRVKHVKEKSLKQLEKAPVRVP